MTSLAPDLCPHPWSAHDFQAEMKATASQLDDLFSYRALLEDANRRMNLVGPSAMADFWRRHAFDSAQLLHVEQSALQWADIGAGAGFPGVILAILLKGRKGACVHLIESMAKRASFLQGVVDTLQLPAEVHHARAESLVHLHGLEIITARACAPFPRLFEYTSHLFEAGVAGLFLKGRGAEVELTEARRDWWFSSQLVASRSDPNGRIVRIQKLMRRG